MNVSNVTGDLVVEGETGDRSRIDLDCWLPTPHNRVAGQPVR
jgi:hypothetical protein